MNAPGITPTSCVVPLQTAVDGLETNLDLPTIFAPATLGRLCYLRLNINVRLPVLMQMRHKTHVLYTDTTSLQVKGINIQRLHWLDLSFHPLYPISAATHNRPSNCNIKMDQVPQSIVHENHRLSYLFLKVMSQ